MMEIGGGFADAPSVDDEVALGPWSKERDTCGGPSIASIAFCAGADGERGRLMWLADRVRRRRGGDRVFGGARRLACFFVWAGLVPDGVRDLDVPEARLTSLPIECHGERPFSDMSNRQDHKQQTQRTFW